MGTYIFLNFKKQKTIKGFTLVETLVAIFIFVLATGALSGIVVSLYQTHGYTFRESVAIEQAHRGIEIMVREIRTAKTGDNGAYPVELADDKQFIFYSDINGDGKTERVRYFLSMEGSTSSGSQIQECTAASTGGYCNVTFSNFFTGTLQLASLDVSVRGDFDNSSNEYAEIKILDNWTTLIPNLCQYSCSHCSASYEGTTTFNVISQASDNSIQFRADAYDGVSRQCPVAGPYDHAMKARFELSWTGVVTATGTSLLKGVIEPVGDPVQYPQDQEQISVISSYVRNVPPIFEYLDVNGDKITDIPARLVDTKVMKIYLVVNVDPNRPPKEFELESSVQLRNLKTE